MSGWESQNLFIGSQLTYLDTKNENTINRS